MRLVLLHKLFGACGPGAVYLLLAAAPAASQELRYGDEAALGDGAVRTYLAVDAQGHPLELGVALSETALATLPDLADKPDEEAFLMFDLDFPEGTPTPFRFVSID